MTDTDKESKKYISKEKRDELKDELDHLKNTRRQEVAKEIERAKALGDLSENAEYQQARADQANLEGRISEIKELLREAEIVEKTQSDTVQVGSSVTIRKKHSSKEQEYEIVGKEEADMSAGKISHTSPVAAALMDHQEGETVEIETPNGSTEYTIESIE
jgi:transcription elongation factor GreA